MVALALCGTICGADTWADIERFSLAHQQWFEPFLELPNGVPSHDTFGRVFRCLDTAEFQACLSKWVEHLQFSLRGKTISIDGKTLRGSHDHASGQNPLHIVNVWAKHVSFCLGSFSVDDKTNEIPAVQELLSILNLKGGAVTADATPQIKVTEQMAQHSVQIRTTGRERAHHIGCRCSDQSVLPYKGLTTPNVLPFFVVTEIKLTLTVLLSRQLA